MRPHLLCLVLLLAIVATTVPLVSAICMVKHEKSESKSEAAATAERSVETLSLDEYGVPKKVAEKPKEENPSTASEKPVEEDVKSSAPKQVKKEKSDDFDVSEYFIKRRNILSLGSDTTPLLFIPY